MIIPPHIAAALDNRRFHLILFVTEQCNFRCKYCYEDFRLGTMSPDVVVGIKKLITKKIPELDTLTISWFGGEPLLAQDVVKTISDTVLTGRDAGLTYFSNMTTNGYLLTADVLQRMIKLGIGSYQISFDGDEQGHDKTRIKRNGSGTFDSIWNNVVAAKGLRDNFRIVLRLHFSPNNLSSLNKLIDKINAEFSSDNRFEIHFAAINGLGGPGHSNVVKMSEDEKRSILAILLSRLDTRVVRHKLSAPDTPYVCYASKANSIAIRSDGSVAKCTVALASDTNRVGFIDESGSISVDNTKVRPWISGLLTQEISRLACPYPYVVSRSN